jgi:hypothetical protein
MRNVVIHIAPSVGTVPGYLAEGHYDIVEETGNAYTMFTAKPTEKRLYE